MIQFNEQQQKAIDFYTGACSIIAGAGSGKTSVLVHRIKNLIENHHIKESDILAISFTRNSASDLKKKLSSLGFVNVNVGTFHSICGDILFKNNIDVSNIIKEWQVEKCLKEIDKKANVKDIISFIGYQKNYLKSYNDTFMLKESNYSEIELRKFYKAYETYKKKNSLYDLDDWLIKCYNLLNKINVSYNFILADEFQDLNLVQNLILKQICKSGNIFAVGDFRQSIYGFRGAVPEMFMNFHKEWNNTTIINMDTNYRSSNNIVEYANSFIKQYYGDYEHYSDSIAYNKNNGNIKLFTFNDAEDESIKIIDIIELLFKTGESPNEIAILYRLNSNSGSIENELRKRDIAYDINNESSFFKRKEIVGILSYLRLINNSHDDEAFENIFKLRNYPIDYFSNDLFEKIKKYAGKNNLSLYESFISYQYPQKWQKDKINIFKDNITRLKMQYEKKISISTLIDNIVRSFNFDDYIYDKYTDTEDFKDRMNSIDTLKLFVKGNDIQNFITYIESANTKKKKNSDTIKLMTIHSSKGLEFKHVFIVGIEDSKFPHEKSLLKDEARLFYVGITRSKENLYLSQIREGNKFINEYFNDNFTKS